MTQAQISLFIWFPVFFFNGDDLLRIIGCPVQVIDYGILVGYPLFVCVNLYVGFYQCEFFFFSSCSFQWSYRTFCAARKIATPPGLTDSKFFTLGEGEAPGEVIDCVAPLLLQGLCLLLFFSPSIPHCPLWGGGNVNARGILWQASHFLMEDRMSSQGNHIRLVCKNCLPGLFPSQKPPVTGRPPWELTWGNDPRNRNEREKHPSKFKEMWEQEDEGTR